MIDEKFVRPVVEEELVILPPAGEVELNKEDVAIARIQAAFAKNGRTISGHSGGKDSVVIHDLIKRAGVKPFVTLHSPKPLIDNCTEDEKSTAMYKETLNFLYENVGTEWTLVVLPRPLTQDWLRDNIVTCQVDGSRLCEYTRKDKSGNFIVNGETVSRKLMTEYIENGIFGLNLSYPIFDWSDDDVFDYITKYNLKISDEYNVNGELESYHARKNKPKRKGRNSSAAR